MQDYIPDGTRGISRRVGGVWIKDNYDDAGNRYGLENVLKLCVGCKKLSFNPSLDILSLSLCKILS